MVFSDSTGGSGIVEMVRRLTNTSSVTYPINDLTANVNAVYSDYVSILLSSDTRWNWDDANFTTLPVATTDLNNGQRDYQFNDQFLKILKVLIKQPDNGQYVELEEINLQDSVSDLDAWSMNIDDASNTGTPNKFTLVGDTLRLQPRPNYSVSNGIKVLFQRYEQPFVTTDTTAQPGFPQPFHIGLAYGAAHLFALSHDQKNVDRLGQMNEQTKNALKTFMSQRNKAERLRMTTAKVNAK